MQDIRSKYLPPRANEKSFNCPYCGVLAEQYWHSTYAKELDNNTPPGAVSRLEAYSGLSLQKGERICDSWVRSLFISQCHCCKGIALWIEGSLVHPRKSPVPSPNPDLPGEVRKDYCEASRILSDSPRGAAALLRLSVQKLCKHLGGKGGNLNDDIKLLVEKGLDAKIQKALDTLRIVGNHAVHPGQIDIDDRETTESLFTLVNRIADTKISQPKHTDEMFDKLPKTDIKAIKERDKGK